jgi:hypothetical protein
VNVTPAQRGHLSGTQAEIAGEQDQHPLTRTLDSRAQRGHGARVRRRNRVRPRRQGYPGSHIQPLRAVEGRAQRVDRGAPQRQVPGVAAAAVRAGSAICGSDRLQEAHDIRNGVPVPTGRAVPGCEPCRSLAVPQDRGGGVQPRRRLAAG